MQRIELALAQLFRRHRIVFWYEVKKQMRAVYEAFSLPEIGKIEPAENAFGVKWPYGIRTGPLLPEQPRRHGGGRCAKQGE